MNETTRRVTVDKLGNGTEKITEKLKNVNETVQNEAELM